MVSNLSCLGFSIANEDELQDLVLKLAGDATTGLAVPAGEYRIWRSRTGAELWFHLPEAPSGSTTDAANEREITGLTPFFEGKSAVGINVTSRFQRDRDTQFEGALQGWVIDPATETNPGSNPASADTDDDDLDDGSYPIIFDSVDCAAKRDLDLPSRQTIRLTGFAREVVAYPDLAAFEAAQKSSPHPLAEKAFFPVGLFAAASGEKPTPSSHAMFAGTVIESSEMTNEHTGSKFHWLLVESLDATFDVVADPSCITGKTEPGAIVQIACWMFGRILEENETA